MAPDCRGIHNQNATAASTTYPILMWTAFGSHNRRSYSPASACATKGTLLVEPSHASCRFLLRRTAESDGEATARADTVLRYQHDIVRRVDAPPDRDSRLLSLLHLASQRVVQLCKCSPLGRRAGCLCLASRGLDLLLLLRMQAPHSRQAPGFLCCLRDLVHQRAESDLWTGVLCLRVAACTCHLGVLHHLRCLLLQRVESRPQHSRSGLAFKPRRHRNSRSLPRRHRNSRSVPRPRVSLL